MDRRELVWIGAGNMRCALHVVWSLAHWKAGEAQVTLFEANEERLDLVDRFARKVFDDHNKDLVVRSTSDLGEAVGDAEFVVFSLNEDGSRRMVAGQSEEALVDVENNESMLFRRGDGNRPTPVANLSPMMRKLLSRPAEEGDSREGVIQSAAEQVLKVLPPGILGVSLMRGVEIEIEGLNEPEALSEAELVSRPHEILRWISGDEPAHREIEAVRDRGLVRWLNSSGT